MESGVPMSATFLYVGPLLFIVQKLFKQLFLQRNSVCGYMFGVSVEEEFKVSLCCHLGPFLC